MKWLADNMHRLLFWLVVAILIMLAAPTWSDEGHGHDHGGGDGAIVDVDTSSEIVGGDIAIEGDKSKVFGFGHGLGDVDIAQCLGSTQWDTIIAGKQKLVLNQICMAEFYLKQGRYDLAAQALCNQPEILTEYETEDTCELDHDFTPAFVPVPEVSNDEDIEIVQMAQVSLEERVAQLEQKPAPRPRIVQAAPEPESEMSLEEKEYILGLLMSKGSDEDE